MVVGRQDHVPAIFSDLLFVASHFQTNPQGFNSASDFKVEGDSRRLLRLACSRAGLAGGRAEDLWRVARSRVGNASVHTDWSP